MIWKKIFRGFDRTVKPRARRQGKEFSPPKSYEEGIDELTQWNVENTDILRILREDISDERLSAWSEDLNKGIRKAMRMRSAQRDTTYDTYLDLYKFIIQERIKLMREPSMKGAKATEDLDPITVCIVCGIRALQKELGLSGLMNTMRLKLLQRYFERAQGPALEKIPEQ